MVIRVTIEYITLGISILSIFIAAFAAVSTFWINRRKDYKTIITTESTRWLNNLREDVVDFICLATEIYVVHSINFIEGPFSANNELPLKVKELNKKSLMIKFRINPNEVETINKVSAVVMLQSKFNIAHTMCESDKEIYLKKVDKEVTACLDDFEKHMRNFFQQQWDKIQSDAAKL